jgi:hypothetical protein
MKAVQYRAVGRAPEVVEVPVPEPDPGQVLLTDQRPRGGAAARLIFSPSGV